METPAAPLVLLRVAALPFESLETLRAGSSLARLHELLALEREMEGEADALSEALYRAAGPPVPGDSERNRTRLAIVTLRRAVYNRRRPDQAHLQEAAPGLDPALARSLERHVERGQRFEALEKRFREAFSVDLCASRSALMAIGGSALFQEGIRLASRTLFKALKSLQSADPGRWDYDDRHVASKFASYVARGAAKTSPQSVFCTTALVQVASGSARVGGENRASRTEVLLNVFEARKVTSCLAAEPALRAAARLRPNPTLREMEGGWTYWRPALLRRPTDAEVLSRVKDLPVLRMFLEEASVGTRRVEEILQAVAARSEAEVSDLTHFLEGLVESGIFLWEVEIPYSCRRPLEALARTCREAGCLPPWLGEAEEIERQVTALGELTSGERIERLDGIQQRLESLPHVRPLKEDEIFRLDAASGLEISLPSWVLADLQEAMEWYARLFASLYPESLLRADYAERFLRAHPADHDVELLDLYHGLFEPEPARRPSSFPEPAGARTGEATEKALRSFVRARDAFARLARRAEAEGAEEVALTREDWSAILEETPVPPWFSGVLFQVDGAGEEAVSTGGARLALNGIFSGSGLAAARLAHLHGTGRTPAQNPIALDVKREWARLEREGAILAEITYMHWGRTANAGLRLPIFPYEIELPGEKASEGAEVIPLRELAVRYDSGRKRFVLRWLPRGLEVIPVIGSGISPEGFVSFLVSLGQQGFQPLGYFPGFEAEGIVAWPRFLWNRTVLFRRRWIFPPEAVPRALADPSAPEAEVFAALARLRCRHRLPRHVFVHTTADPKPFYSDLESPILADLVRRAASSRDRRAAPTLTFTEMLPPPEGIWVRDGKGRYASEFLVQLHGPSHGAPDPKRR
ncbi:MAG TPA: lantibiotic dehydratase [Candidatus Polarisedimenticolia bacterium]|nr:lantibiotic dehydratase [Candidatus Polarisedimenticolia bacterium]